MEIKIKEAKNSLRIEKNAKKELFYSNLLSIILIILVLYKFREIIFSFGSPIFIILGSPFIYILYRFFSIRFAHEVIFIDKEKIYFWTNYSYKESYYKEEFLIINLEDILAKQFHRPIIPKGQKIGIQTVKNNWLYRVHFYFSKNGETYKCWGYEIPMEEAEKVVKKIKKFLKEHNNIELK